ncbi:hypothetical protein BH10BAC5_BH10BAC5_18620 [soil metagenome]
MNKFKFSKQILIIFLLAVTGGFAINFVSPKSVPLVGDFKARLNEGKSDSIMQKVSTSDLPMNDPYDTSSTKKINPMSNRQLSSEGFYKPENIKIDLAKKFYDMNALFIDGRTDEEFKAGHIKNAIHITYEELVKMTKEEKIEKMRKFNKDGIIVCYCKGGTCEVSIDLAYEIAKIGFNSVNIYLGGYKEWEDKGYPVEKP